MAGKQRVAIVGVGYSTIGRDTGLSLDTLTAQASIAAMDDAGVGPADIDGVVVHSFPHQYVSSTHTAAMLGIPDLAFYSSSVDGAAYAVRYTTRSGAVVWASKASVAGVDITVARQIGLALIVTGALLIVSGAGGMIGSRQNIGHAMFIGAAMLWAGYTVAMRKARLEGLHAAAIAAV